MSAQCRFPSACRESLGDQVAFVPTAQRSPNSLQSVDSTGARRAICGPCAAVVGVMKIALERHLGPCRHLGAILDHFGAIVRPIVGHVRAMCSLLGVMRTALEGHWEPCRALGAILGLFGDCLEHFGALLKQSCGHFPAILGPCAALFGAMSNFFWAPEAVCCKKPASRKHSKTWCVLYILAYVSGSCAPI